MEQSRDTVEEASQGWVCQEGIQEVRAFKVITSLQVISALSDSIEEGESKGTIRLKDRVQISQEYQNIVNHFSPILRKLKARFGSLGDLGKSTAYLRARLLVSHGYPITEELQRCLGESEDVVERQKCDKFLSELEKLVLSLLRVEVVKEQHVKICGHFQNRPVSGGWS